MKIFAILLALFAIPAVGQSVNPQTGITWPRVTGAGVPTSTCPSATNTTMTATVGTPYTNTTANTQYVCGSAGWVLLGAGAGGSPGGTSGQTQYNNGGTFGGYTPSGDIIVVPSTGVETVKGLNGVPFCTGFTPTNGQSVQYTTGSSPNPCYTAATGGSVTLAGDVTGPSGSNTVVKVNGGSLPISQGFTGTDSNGKIISSPYVPYQTPPVTGTLATNMMARFNYFQQTGTVLTDISGGTAICGGPCNGTLGTGGAAPTWLSNGLLFTYLADQNVALPSQLNTAQTFASYFYYYPVSLVPSTSPTTYNGSYSPLYSSSVGTAGFNAINQAPTGDAPESFGQSAIWNSSLQTEAYNFSTGPHTYVHVLGTGGGSLDHIYIDGVESPLVVQGATAGAQTAAGGHIDIGSSGVGPWASQGGQMIMYNTIIYSDQKTAADAMALHQLFVADVATRGVNTSPQPLNIGLPQLNCVGDSLSTIINVTSPWCSLLTLINQPTYTVNIWGIGGTNLQTLTASEPNRVARYCKTTVGGSSPTVVWAETNDFAQGATVAQVLDAMAGEVAVLKQAGCTVFVGTMIDRTTPDLHVQKNAYNSALRIRYKGWGAVGIVDFADNPLLGADGASASSTYFGGGGGIHWNNTGQALGVSEANSSLNYYYGANAASPTIITATTATLTADQGYVNVQPTGNTTLTLPSCLGQTGAIYTINMQGANSLTIKNAASSEPINGTDYSSTGLVSLAGAGTVTFIDVANPSAAAGCHWDTEAAPGASGGGNTISTSLTAPKIPKANGANSIVDSSVSDDPTTVTFSKIITITTGTGLGGGFDGTEGTAHTGASSFDELWADSTAHRLKMNNNNGGAFFVPGISSAATAGHIATYASNGIDIVDGGAVPTGAVASVTATNSTLTISPTTGAVLAGLNIANANIWTGTQSINLTGSTHPTLPTNTIDFTANVNASSTRRVSSSFGATSFFSVLRADGTAASPTQVLATEQVGGINAWAWNSSAAYNGPIASLRYFADENQTATAAGSRMDFITTPDGSTTAVSRLSIEADGGVIIAGLTAGTSAICPNGTGGRLTTSGCAGGAAPTFQVNGVALTSSGTINYRTGTGNGGVVLTNPSAGNVDANLSLPFDATGTTFPTLSSTFVSTHVPQFSGTAGKMIDSGFAIGGFAQLAGSSNNWTKMQEYTVGSTITAASTVAPTTPIVLFTGNSTAVDTITAPLGTGALIGASFDWTAATAGFSFTTAGNIANALTTSQANQSGRCVFNGTTNGKWVCTTLFAPGSTTVTPTAGTGVTSVTCATATCTTARGSYTIVGGTGTTGTIASLAWTATGTAWVCTATMNGGATAFNIGNSVATTTGMNITAGISIVGSTFTVNYSCIP